jgi:hypothetical protein
LSDLQPIRIGDRIPKFPARTFNALVAGEVRDRLKPATLNDGRDPKSKSCVLVQLAWGGDDPVEPGHVVKLGDVIADESTEPAAPYSPLVFHAAEFEASDGDKPFAILLEPIGAVARDGEDAIIERSVGFGFIVEAAWAQVNLTDAGHTRALRPTSGTLFQSAASGGLPIVYRPSGTGTKWCVVSLISDTGSSDPCEPTVRKPCAIRYGNVLDQDPPNLVGIRGKFDPGGPGGYVCLWTYDDKTSVEGSTFVENKFAAEFECGTIVSLFEFADGHFEVNTGDCQIVYDPEDCEEEEPEE